MMYVLELLSLCAIVGLCIFCTTSDIRRGLIYNKLLVIFAVFSVVIDIIYYGFYAQEFRNCFIANLAVIVSIGLYLFYSHTFAGGDCKMIFVLALLYPAKFYFVYGNSSITLFLSIGFAIFAGYIYLLFNSLNLISQGKTKLTFHHFAKGVKDFIRIYFSAMVFLSFLNCIFVLLSKKDIIVNDWIMAGCCLITAWCVGKFSILNKKCLLFPMIVVVTAVSVITNTMPISLNFKNYILVFILLFSRIVIKTSIYESVDVSGLKEGMILSTISSILMQSSITKGLPKVSSEDLKSRLSASEIDSIKIWAKATHTKELTIVKKIPFAIFISIGLLSYFILWSITK